MVYPDKNSVRVGGEEGDKTWSVPRFLRPAEAALVLYLIPQQHHIKSTWQMKQNRLALAVHACTWACHWLRIPTGCVCVCEYVSEHSVTQISPVWSKTSLTIKSPLFPNVMVNYQNLIVLFCCDIQDCDTDVLLSKKTLLFIFLPDKDNKYIEADVMGLDHASQYRGYVFKPELISP